MMIQKSTFLTVDLLVKRVKKLSVLFKFLENDGPKVDHALYFLKKQNSKCLFRLRKNVLKDRIFKNNLEKSRIFLTFFIKNVRKVQLFHGIISLNN